MTSRRRCIGKVAGTLLLLLSCGACATSLANGEHDPGVAEGRVLDLDRPTMRQVVGPEVQAPATRKFVQIEVTQVCNPRRIPLSFTVHFESAQGEEIYLGSFSLFPPDNPGKFIVATRGQLKTGDTVSVTLVPLERVSDDGNIRVWVQPLTFLPE